jgi:hypothetical protein
MAVETRKKFGKSQPSASEWSRETTVVNNGLSVTRGVRVVAGFAHRWPRALKFAFISLIIGTLNWFVSQQIGMWLFSPAMILVFFVYGISIALFAGTIGLLAGDRSYAFAACMAAGVALSAWGGMVALLFIVPTCLVLPVTNAFVWAGQSVVHYDLEE